MNVRINKIIASLKLIALFVLGYLLWKCALSGIDSIVARYQITSLWAVAISRLALFGYLLPFIVWFCFEPHKLFGIRAGDTKASIKMPFIWYGINDNVRNVSIGFSLLCVTLACIFLYISPLSASTMLAGIAFSVINSVLEEFLWRGFILSRTIDLWGEKLGLILMSLAFGLYHYPLGFSLPVCLLFSLGGIYFGGIAIRSKGLLLGTVMHISMNLFFVSIGII